jgi:hypothetical protein
VSPDHGELDIEFQVYQAAPQSTTAGDEQRHDARRGGPPNGNQHAILREGVVHRGRELRARAYRG